MRSVERPQTGEEETTGTEPTIEVSSPYRLEDRGSRIIPAVIRIALGILWASNAGWKRPPEFESLHRFTSFAVSHPVFPPYSWLVDNAILPNFAFFGWLVLLVEAALGAFLLVGLATRFWAVVGMLQTTAIALSVLNAPNEWEWSYYLMFLAHLAIFAAAAGRVAGLDGLLRARWRASQGLLARALVRAS
jgi:thiosulfate dehydrogenase (quinone) large subunit